jgi:hypothetical protein
VRNIFSLFCLSAAMSSRRSPVPSSSLSSFRLDCFLVLILVFSHHEQLKLNQRESFDPPYVPSSGNGALATASRIWSQRKRHASDSNCPASLFYFNIAATCDFCTKSLLQHHLASWNGFELTAPGLLLFQWPNFRYIPKEQRRLLEHN